MGYRIGSFNIRDLNFSDKTPEGESINRDFNKIAEIIVNEGFDVVAIQEVNALLAIKYLTKKINEISREVYAFDFGERMPTNSKDPERYGFIWNTQRLVLLKIPNKQNPTYYVNANGNQLQRPPYYARFSPRGLKNGTNFELRLVNVHIISSGAERAEEFDILAKQVLPRISDHRSVSVDDAGVAHYQIMPAYTVMLGDYNLVLRNGPRIQSTIERITTSNYTGKLRQYITVQEKPTSLRLPNNQTTVEECYANNFDHFSYEDNLLFKLRLEEHRVDTLSRYFMNEELPSEKLFAYRKKVSDHVPIMLTLDLK